MNDRTASMRDYLLGKLPEEEQAALEEGYFRDPRVFDEVAKAESELVEDYVHDRLAPDVRRTFEQVYLADPRRRERLLFAEALATRLEHADAPSPEPIVRATRSSEERTNWLPAFFSPRPAVAYAIALLVIVAGSAWVALEWRRSREEAARVEAARTTAPTGSVPAGNQPSLQTTPIPERSATPAVVTFALAVGPGVRSAETARPATLVIPRDAGEVRLELNLREHEYASYRVILQPIGGAEILRRTNLKPTATSSGALFTLTVPASGFPAGDYVLTLQGATDGKFDDLSQSIFRVEQR